MKNLLEYIPFLALIFIFLALIFILSGCSGTGFEKKTTLVPDSISFGWAQETYRGDSRAWQGFSVSGTWVFK